MCEKNLLHFSFKEGALVNEANAICFRTSKKSVKPNVTFELDANPDTRAINVRKVDCPIKSGTMLRDVQNSCISFGLMERVFVCLLNICCS